MVVCLYYSVCLEKGVIMKNGKCERCGNDRRLWIMNGKHMCGTCVAAYCVKKEYENDEKKS